MVLATLLALFSLYKPKISPDVFLISNIINNAIVHIFMLRLDINSILYYGFIIMNNGCC